MKYPSLLTKSTSFNEVDQFTLVGVLAQVFCVYSGPGMVIDGEVIRDPSLLPNKGEYDGDGCSPELSSLTILWVVLSRTNPVPGTYDKTSGS